MERIYQEFSDRQSSFGRVFKMSGPIIIAEEMAGCRINEVVKIGSQKLIGEVIKIEKDLAYIQCYQDLTGISVGDLVERTKQPLSVELGPGLLASIFDGIQRPLGAIANYSQSIYLPQDIWVPSLDPHKMWLFFPSKIKIGDIINEGDIIGTVFQTILVQNHSIIVPPKCKGRVTYIAYAGEYNIHQELLELEFNGELKKYSMSHRWPIRQPRPVSQRLIGDTPFFTGLRVLDSLFPVFQGGICVLPGASGCGKRIILQSLLKYSNIEVFCSVNCGQRGNEVSQNIQEMYCLTTTKGGRDVSLMNRTSLISNAANMSLASRQASIYTGITIAEYFRDMGLDVLMMGDSTSRWAETLKQISFRLGERPGDFGYPTYLKSRLTQFYERAGKVNCLGSPNRIGSITVVSTVNPSNGEYFNDPLSVLTMQIAHTFWALDRRMGERMHFPEVNWMMSSSKCKQQLLNFYKVNYDCDMASLRKKMQQILDQDTAIYQKINQYGKQYLSEKDKLTFYMSNMIKTEFLQQNVFSSHDFTCPIEKTIGMMKTICLYYELALKLLESKSKSKNKLTFIVLKDLTNKQINRLKQMKFQRPNCSKQQMKDFFNDFSEQISAVFEKIMDQQK